MKKIFLVVLTMLSVLVPLSAQTYDRDAVVKVMRVNQVLLGEVKTALGKSDFFAAASGFWKFAEGNESIRKFTPPKGSKTEWDALLGDFVAASLKGVGACGEKDSAKANQLHAELSALMRKGHPLFR